MRGFSDSESCGRIAAARPDDYKKSQGQGSIARIAQRSQQILGLLSFGR